MQTETRLGWATALSAIFYVGTIVPGFAQSILPTNDSTGTQLTVNGQQIDIGGGTRSGNNLFHSFQQFGLEPGQVANFLATPDLQNILGRVTGGHPSVIDGLIQVTGGSSHLYLMNPSGIIFGPNASLNVPASFTATTANGIGFGGLRVGELGNWFKADGTNNYGTLFGDPTAFRFSDPVSPLTSPSPHLPTSSLLGAIVNSGNLKVNPSQAINLLAGTIVNTGTLTAPSGQITLTAVPGSSLLRLSQPGSLLSLEISPSSLSGAEASGAEANDPPTLAPATLPQLLTGSGLTPPATGLSVDPDGTVRLTATNTAIPQVDGTTIVAGLVDVSTPTPHLPISSLSQGGTVQILGDRTGLFAATINAAGADGGGTVLVGGDFQGQGSLPNAQFTVMDANSLINADALTTGDGGKVILWADQTTRFLGNISARGGPQGGNGGFVEVSGKNYLSFAGQVDTQTANGQAGTLLLDPTDINVVNGTFPAVNATDGLWSTSEDAGTQSIGTNDIRAILATTDLILEASNEITWNSGATLDYNNIGNTGRTLTLRANQTISFNGIIQDGNTVTPDRLNVTFNADRDANGEGAISLTSAVINTNGGNLILGGGSDPLTQPASSFGSLAGIFIGNSTLNAGDGNIFTIGQGHFGIELSNSTITTTSGNVSLTGNSVNGTFYLSDSTITTTLGDVNITGIGAGKDGVSFVNGSGVRSQAPVIRTVGGSITITGNQTSSNGTSGTTFGVSLAGGVSLDSTTGNITITGTSAGNGVYGNYGDGIVVQGTIKTTSGNITITGSYTNPNRGATGVNMEFTSSVNSGVGNITITGTSAGYGYGAFLGSNINTAGGDITITGKNTNLNSQAITTRGLLVNADLQSLAGNVTLEGNSINTTSLVINQDQNIQGKNLSLIANQDISSTGTLSTNGQTLSLVSSNGAITTGNLTTQGGNLVLQAATAITTGTIDTSSLSAGTVSLTAGSTMQTGDILATATSLGDGGMIILRAGQSITTGQLNTSSASGNGGNVTIDPPGLTQVSFINAEARNGVGGTVSINETTSNPGLFRATGSFTALDGTTASISTYGKDGSGSITIRHGGGSATPFVVGQSGSNGTVAAISASSSQSTNTIATGSFPQTHTQGNIQLITSSSGGTTSTVTTDSSGGTTLVSDEVATTGDRLQNDSQATTQPPTAIVDNSPIVTTESLSTETLATTVDTSLTNEFTNYLGIEAPTSLDNLTTAQNTLKGIAEATGVESSLIYINFQPASFNPTLPHQPKQQSPAQDNSQLTLILVTANQAPVLVVVPNATHHQVLALTNRFRAQVADHEQTANASYLTTAQTLYDLLIRPLEPTLQAQKIDHISFVLDNGLRAIPLAALHDGQHFLVENYSVGLMPSLSLTDTRYRDLRNTQVLGAGTDRFTDNLPLPAVPIEVNTIVHQLWSGKALLGQDFTLDNLRAARQFTPYGIVHLATHGDFRPGALSNSYIQLADRRLQLDEIRTLGWNNPPVDLLVLSACRTALGSPEAELGFAGLAVKAGVKTAIASLWSVSDEGTTGLMLEFYQQLRQAPTKAKALQAAQQAMIQGKVFVENGQLHWSGGQVALSPELAGLNAHDLSHPYYWSAFTLIGNPW